MSLADLIRKRDTGNLATAIPAIPATQPKGEAATVARIATIAVANPTEGRPAKPDPLPDDRRTCTQCANLTGRGQCLAARRGEIMASRTHEPVRDLPRRCEGYTPGADDSDRRHGRERWPGLAHKGGRGKNVTPSNKDRLG